MWIQSSIVAVLDRKVMFLSVSVWGKRYRCKLWRSVRLAKQHISRIYTSSNSNNPSIHPSMDSRHTHKIVCNAVLWQHLTISQ